MAKRRSPPGNSQQAQRIIVRRHHTGDYYVKTLRVMLHGDGSMVFFAPYEYEGVRPHVERTGP